MKGANERQGAHNYGAGAGAGAREDCWSEEATAALIEAWGDRYLRLSRGNLRQSDWLDVADAVNASLSAGGGLARPRTDSQCKNRIDTLKKRYKLEKSRPGRSSWPFFPLLRDLLAPSASDKKKPRRFVSPESSADGASSSSPSSENSMGSPRGLVDRPLPVVPVAAISRRSRGRRRSVADADERGAAMRGLARAVARFGDIYERVEGAKQEQMAELERQRMNFAKELEFQKMQMLMEAQLELEKMKRPKHSSASGKKS